MKLKKLNKALIAAGLVASATVSMQAQAVVLSDDGTGEVLLYPFYTVQGPAEAPRSTIVSITNTANTYKAVKVRFHEARNSRDALDFNLYLSPHDVWTGLVLRNSDGKTELQTSDLSCTIPTSIMVNPFVFSTNAFSVATNNDGGSQADIRANEGYIEVIEMGEVVPGDLLLTAPATTGLFLDNVALATAPGFVGSIGTFGDAILHRQVGAATAATIGTGGGGIPGGVLSTAAATAGIPIGCLALEQAATKTTGTWAAPISSTAGTVTLLDNAHNSVTQPTGGLMGNALIVQTTVGTVSAYNAVALKHFYDVEGHGLDGCQAIGGAGLAATNTAGTTYCETNGGTDAASLTNRAWDDLHSFKDLDQNTANSRSIQTYPNLAMAFPQVSTVFSATTGVITNLEWSNNQAVSSGITQTKTNQLFAAYRDLNVSLTTGTGGAVVLSNAATGGAADCGGFEGLQSVVPADGICGNARPVTAVLAKSKLFNSFENRVGAVGGDFVTDVVVTFPTKWFFTDNGLFSVDKVVDGAVPANTVSFSTGGNTPALPPFTNQFTDTSFRDGACDAFSINQQATLTGGVVAGSLFDREETPPAAPAGGVLLPSPAINVNVAGNVLCQEANVITFADGDLLTSRIANGLNASTADAGNMLSIPIDASLTSGWFSLSFDTGTGGPHSMTSVTAGPMSTGAVTFAPAITAAGEVKGLPAIGFVSEGLKDPGAAGTNFTIALPHKFVR